MCITVKLFPFIVDCSLESWYVQKCVLSAYESPRTEHCLALSALVFFFFRIELVSGMINISITGN